MEWLEKLNSAINYVEEHITEDLTIEEVAKIADCSSAHFQRIFAYIGGVTFSEYLRRRRMTLAATRILNGEKVIDVGLDYGYNSPTAFNRAFKSIHGVAPTQIKKLGTVMRAYPVLHFTISVSGGSELNYRIEKKEAFRIVGVSSPLEKEIEKNFKICPKLWAKASILGTVSKLAKMNNKNPKGLLGVSACYGKEEWKYFISCATDLAVPKKMEEYVVPSFTWAIFSGEGPISTMMDLEMRIVKEWLPASGYEYADGPDIELYLNANPKNAKYEVWIPVIKK